MTWKEWIITAVLLLVAFTILYAVSEYGAAKVDRFNAENSGIFVMGLLMPELMPEQKPDKNGRNR